MEIQKDPAQQSWKRAWKYLYLKDDQLRVQHALAGLKLTTDSRSLLWHVTEVYLESGQPEMALDHYRNAYPELLEPSADVELPEVWAARDISRLLIATGKQEQAEHLIAEALKLTHPEEMKVAIPALRYIEAMLFAIAGQETEALAAVKRYLDSGGTPYRIMFGKELESLYDNPEFRGMISEAEAKMAMQLDRIQQMETKGELAPIPPVPET